LPNLPINRLAYYTFQVFTANILGGLLIFLQPILILNLTGEHTLGVFSLLVSWANIGLLFASFGILTAFQRLGNRYYNRHKELEFEAYKFLKGCSVKHLVLTSIGLAVIAAAVHVGEVPLILFPGIILVLVSIYYTRWFLILARIRQNNFWPNIFDQPFREGIFITLALMFWYLLKGTENFSGQDNYNATVLIVIYSISAITSAWVANSYVKSKQLIPGPIIDPGSGLSNPLYQTSINRLHAVWLGIARTSFPSELGIYLIKRIDVIIVSIFVSTESSGIYFLMSRIAELPNLVAGSINVIVGPEFAKMRAYGYEKRRRTLYILASALPSLGTIIMIIGVFYADKLGLLEWVFGQQLDLRVLYLFLFGYTLYFALGPSTVLLTMTGGQKISSMVSSGIVTLHLLSVTLLTNWLGETGAALAFCISIILQRIIELTFIVTKKNKSPQ